MKKLDYLIIKSYLGPLLMTFSISIFVLLIQFLWKQLEQLVGKGLDTIVILQLLWYACATLVPMALPLAILLASIMTMGNFGERYELAAMKAAGVSLWRVLRPLIVVSIILAVFAFYFSNNLMPMANMKMRTILYEIKTKKPTVNIRPNEFYSEIDGYVIRVAEKDKEGKNMKDVIIYDHSKDLGNVSITVAKNGQMFTEENGNILVFKLSDGYVFDETYDQNNFYKNPLLRLNFKEQTIRFDLSSFAYEKTDKDRYAGHYKMMDIVQLNNSIKDIEKEHKSFTDNMTNNILINIAGNNNKNSLINTGNKSFYSIIDTLNSNEKNNLNLIAKESVNQAKIETSVIKGKKEYDEQNIRQHNIEWHRKFTLSAACVILFFIGAPLGAIILKGGLGLPTVLSVLSFILYYVVGMIGEKSALEGAISCGLGMWSSTLVFLPIGLFLTMKATSDSTIMNIEGWQKIFRGIKQKISRKHITTK